MPQVMMTLRSMRQLCLALLVDILVVCAFAHKQEAGIAARRTDDARGTREWRDFLNKRG